MAVSTRRRDHRGRVLRTGEGERKDGTYCFRYTDKSHKRHSVYAPTLEALREKEAKIQLSLVDNADYEAGTITVEKLLERYISLKRAARNSTQSGYKFVQGVVSKYPFGKQRIRDIKISDAKLWFIQLYDDGYAWNTIASIRGVVKPAFQMAFAEETIRRNPFDFRLDIIPNNTQKRTALTKKQQTAFLSFIANDNNYRRYLDEIVVLLGTGMRISEFCGLTMTDLDFEQRKICVDHQLVRTNHGKRKPKAAAVIFL